MEGGATMVQLREKKISTEELIREAAGMRELCHRYGVPLIVNDNVEAAIKSGADGVHVGMEDMPVKDIRAMAGKDFIIGATAKTVEQAQEAEAAGADYLGVGAVFPSPTKRNAIRITTEDLRRICDAVSIPVVAIGRDWPGKYRRTRRRRDGRCGSGIRSFRSGGYPCGCPGIEKKVGGGHGNVNRRIGIF